MLRSLIVTACIACSGSLLHAAGNGPVAAMHKPVGTVDCSIDGTWKKAVPAMPLYSGNIVRTQENSFAIVKFLENSIIRVQEKSEVEIRGTKTDDKEFSKNVHLRTGTVGFNVKKRPNEKFEFSTPTSVASIRGTEGALMSGSDSTDLLVLQSGSVLFTNNFSNQSVTVNGGQTGHSRSNGQIDVRPSSSDDINRMHRVQQLGGTNGTGGGGTDSTGANGTPGGAGTGQGQQQGSQQNEEIRIQVTDPSGNHKTMIIKPE
ncbi:MAG: FecR domain-containing protein [Acidobacteriota bacterium]